MKNTAEREERKELITVKIFNKFHRVFVWRKQKIKENVVSPSFTYYFHILLLFFLLFAIVIVTVDCCCCNRCPTERKQGNRQNSFPGFPGNEIGLGTS